VVSFYIFYNIHISLFKHIQLIDKKDQPKSQIIIKGTQSHECSKKLSRLNKIRKNSETEHIIEDKEPISVCPFQTMFNEARAAKKEKEERTDDKTDMIHDIDNELDYKKNQLERIFKLLKEQELKSAVNNTKSNLAEEDEEEEITNEFQDQLRLYGL
jgi:hypothetical protein